MYAALAVGNGALNLFNNNVRSIKDRNIALGVRVGFAHLFGRILQRHDLCALLAYVCVGNGKGRRIDGVEAVCNVARNFKVLLLVNSDGNKIRLIKQNIRSHKHGIGKKTDIDVIGVSL